MIVNVQIKGLYDDNPHLKGFILTPKSRKVIECGNLKQYFYFERRFNKKVCEEKNSITFVKNVY